MECIFRGKLITDADPFKLLRELEWVLIEDLAIKPPSMRLIVTALDKLSQKLLRDKDFLIDELLGTGLSHEEAVAAKNGAAQILSADELYKKIRRELGEFPLEITRITPREPQLEGWVPVGILGHVTSSNAAVLPFLSAVEGLISGNINLVKTGTGASKVAMKLAEELCKIDAIIEPYIYILPISSKEKQLLEIMFSCCDAIAVWGSDAAVDGVHAVCPKGIPIITWGHRISFAYISKNGVTDDALEGICRDVCVNEQQACSAPQIVYFETDSNDELVAFAQKLFDAMKKISPTYPLHTKSDEEWAELTSQTQLAKLSQIMNDGKAFDGHDFRIYVQFDNTPASSPLNRTILVKKLNRKDIVRVLRPFRSYLQTAGLSADTQDIEELSTMLIRAGVTRVVSAGEMMNSYTGEPHDGVYALSRYVKRISIENKALPKTIMDLSEFSKNTIKPYKEGTPVLDKKDFPSLRPIENGGFILLKSGGSSGEAVYAPHTYLDAEMTYKTAGRAMIACGLDPKTDICMNLFFCGSLYGGFISMYEGLKYIDAIQLPMGADSDLDYVVNEIIIHNVNVLMGMPTYLIKLFSEKETELKEYGKIQKVLYGGEHFNSLQVQKLKDNFKIEEIVSLAYGCNEIGSIGYQCEHCSGSEHHLFASKYMEILKMECDEPVSEGEVGRIILTPIDKENTGIERYEIGDLGRYISKPCSCGRTAPKFELLGRFGDIFRFTICYINFSSIKRILMEHANYAGWLQLVLEHDSQDILKVCVEPNVQADKILKALYDNSPEIKNVLNKKFGEVLIINQEKDNFIISSAGGKVRGVVDNRK